MALLFSSFFYDLIFLVVGGFLYLYYFYQRKFKYWGEKGLPHTKPKFPVGDFEGIGKTKSLGYIITELYNRHKNKGFIGFWSLWNPSLMLTDLKLIKNVLVKDFNYFHDRGFHMDTKLDPLLGHLFVMNGQEWRNLRIKLTPTFTSGKMKMMFPTMVNVGEEMKKVLDDTANRKETIEVKDILSRFTMDVIASCAFGIEISSLKNPDSDFRKYGLSVFKPSPRQAIGNVLSITFPKLLSLLRFRLVPKDMTDFFMGVVTDTINYRETNNVKRNDFMQLLIQLKNKGYVEDADAVKNPEDQPADQLQKFTIEQAAAQAFVFFVAGFETSSTTMQYALYELAVNPEIQQNVRYEIDRVVSKNGGKLTYEGLQEMEYLERVVAETLRMYPPVTVIMRECTKDYRIPETDYTVEKGTLLSVPVMGIHRDPDYYPNPKKFDPDRFTPEEKEKRDHYAYLPFGEGPRICIGNRFGLMQSKIGLAVLLSAYEFEVSEKMTVPLKLDPKMDIITPIGGVHLVIKKRMISSL